MTLLLLKLRAVSLGCPPYSEQGHRSQQQRCDKGGRAAEAR
ncbi:hypothetical protein ACQI5H_23080 [Mycobacterium heidelbergense]